MLRYRKSIDLAAPLLVRTAVVGMGTPLKFSDNLRLANGGWGTLNGRIAIEALWSGL